MTVRLATLTDTDAEPTARWREAARAYLRTPYVRSVEEQRAFIRELPAHRHEYRYWAVKADTPASPEKFAVGWETVGIAGLSPIQWENGLAEVSLVLDPARIGKGHGGAAFALLLDEAFDNLRLEQVIAEIYMSNPAVRFWARMAEKYEAARATLPKRKFVGGRFQDALYLSFQRGVAV
jgi:RimJ/RimL family protein N-acetyltransferase